MITKVSVSLPYCHSLFLPPPPPAGKPLHLSARVVSASVSAREEEEVYEDGGLERIAAEAKVVKRRGGGKEGRQGQVELAQALKRGGSLPHFGKLSLFSSFFFCEATKWDVPTHVYVAKVAGKLCTIHPCEEAEEGRQLR